MHKAARAIVASIASVLHIVGSETRGIQVSVPGLCVSRVVDLPDVGQGFSVVLVWILHQLHPVLSYAESHEEVVVAQVVIVGVQRHVVFETFVINILNYNIRNKLFHIQFRNNICVLLILRIYNI